MKKQMGTCLMVVALAVFLAACQKSDAVVPLEKIGTMTEDEIEKKLSGVSREKLVLAWGDPVWELFGMDGEIFELDENRTILVYYDGADREVTEVRFGEKENEELTGTLQFQNQVSVELLKKAPEAVETDWDKVVSEQILSLNEGKYTGEECQAEGHVILGKKEDQGVMTVYALTMYGEYQFQNGNFVKEAGSGVLPMVFQFLYNERGSYKLKDYERPKDGGDYGDSIREMFPEEYWDTCFSPDDEVQEELKKQEQAYALQYLKELGREARIGDFGDFSYETLTDAGVSVDVSNRISENKDLGEYPFWLGSLERLENGHSYEYRMELDEEIGRILFTKTDMETGEVKEHREFDLKTGEETDTVES